MHNCAQLESDQSYLILKYEIKGVNYIFENIRFLDNIGEQLWFLIGHANADIFHYQWTCQSDLHVNGIIHKNSSIYYRNIYISDL